MQQVGKGKRRLSQYRQNLPDEIPRELPEDALQCFKYPAGRGQENQAKVEDLETGYRQQGFHDSRPRDIRLVKPQLADPTADMKGKRETNQHGYDEKIKLIIRSKPPW